MVRRWMSAVSVGVVLAIGAGPVAAEVIAYPKKGQTQEQFQHWISTSATWPICLFCLYFAPRKR